MQCAAGPLPAPMVIADGGCVPHTIPPSHPPHLPMPILPHPHIFITCLLVGWEDLPYFLYACLYAMRARHLFISYLCCALHCALPPWFMCSAYTVCHPCAPPFLTQLYPVMWLFIAFPAPPCVPFQLPFPCSLPVPRWRMPPGRRGRGLPPVIATLYLCPASLFPPRRTVLACYSCPTCPLLPHTPYTPPTFVAGKWLFGCWKVSGCCHACYAFLTLERRRLPSSVVTPLVPRRWGQPSPPHAFPMPAMCVNFPAIPTCDPTTQFCELAHYTILPLAAYIPLLPAPWRCWMP